MDRAPLLLTRLKASHIWVFLAALLLLEPLPSLALTAAPDFHCFNQSHHHNLSGYGPLTRSANHCLKEKLFSAMWIFFLAFSFHQWPLSSPSSVALGFIFLPVLSWIPRTPLKQEKSYLCLCLQYCSPAIALSITITAQFIGNSSDASYEIPLLSEKMFV